MSSPHSFVASFQRAPHRGRARLPPLRRARARAATSSCAALPVRSPPGRSRDLDPMTAPSCSVVTSRAPQDLAALLAHAQAERGRLGEAACGSPRSRAALRQHAKVRERPSLLAEARADRHVEDARRARAAGRRRARSPRRSCRRRRTRGSATKSASVVGSADRRRRARTPSRARCWACPGNARVPAPQPTPASRPASRRASQSAAGTRWRTIAAPVGVTRSPAMPSSRQG